jgi:16S rRNA (uracil1498-N3)-methyltransferase
VHPGDEPGPFVFVDDLDAPTLRDDDRHHLVRVLRTRSGGPVVLGDGAGGWRTGVLGATDVEATGPVQRWAPPRPELTIGFALVKGDKPELIVQKLTELGVDRIVPFRADRSVVRWDDAKATKAVARLRTVARAAAMQSHRPVLPTVEDVADIAALAARPGAALADRTGAAPSLDRPVLLVGPEGGWTDAERQAAPGVALGAHVLRAETAAVTAGSLLTALRAGLIAPSP